MRSTAERSQYAVIGAGCGGQTIAGYLASIGLDVSLYNRSSDRTDPLKRKGYIELEGALRGIGKPSYVGNDMAEAVRGRDVIMVVTTADAHRDLAAQMAPYLEDGQIVLLNPGRTCGALEFAHTLRKNWCSADVITAETNTLVYVTRVKTPGVATVKGVKKEVSASALRKCDTHKVLSAITPTYPQFVAADSFLETGLGNIGAVLHPAIMLLNKDRIMREEPFEFYSEGVDQKVAQFIDEVDREVVDVAKALDTRPLTLKEWLSSRYGIKQAGVGLMITSNPAYKGIGAPSTMDCRYLWEDIPTGLVPIAAFGECLGVSTPALDYLIDEGCNVLDRDFRKEGRTPEKLGLSRDNLKDDLRRVMYIGEEVLVW